MNKKNVFLIASGGGHSTEHLLFKPEFAHPQVQDVIISNVEDDSIKGEYVKVPTFNISLEGMKRAVILFIKAFILTLKYRPKLIISTGSEVAIPFIYYGKFLFRSKVIYSSQVKNPSITGRVVYPLTDKFYVQWPSMLKCYGSKAEFYGGLLCYSSQPEQ